MGGMPADRTVLTVVAQQPGGVLVLGPDGVRTLVPAAAIAAVRFLRPGQKMVADLDETGRVLNARIGGPAQSTGPR